MRSQLLVNPRYRQMVQRWGLDQFDRVMSRTEGARVGAHAMRDVQHIRVEGIGESLDLYLKREWQTYLKDRLAGWLGGLGWSTKARREWNVLQAMRRAGIGCPEPVAMAERGVVHMQGYLAVRALPGAIELAEYLRRQRPKIGVLQRRSLAAHLGKEIARLHEAGIDHPDLFAKHVFLTDPVCQATDTETKVWFIDMQRSSIRRTVSLGRRLRDLASLDATLPLELANAADRLVFLRSYLDEIGQSVAVRSAVRAIRRRTFKLRRRRKIYEMFRGSD